MKLLLFFLLFFLSFKSFSQDRFLNYKNTIEQLLLEKQFVKAKDNFNEMLMLCNNTKYNRQITALRKKMLASDKFFLITEENVNESFKYNNPQLYKNVVGALYVSSITEESPPQIMELASEEYLEKRKLQMDEGKFSSYELMPNGMGAIIIKKNNKCGLLNAKLEQILPIEYLKIEPFGAYVKVVDKNSKESYFSLMQEKLVLPFFNYVSDIYTNNDTQIVICYKEKYDDQALFNLNGKPIVNFSKSAGQKFSIYSERNLIGIYSIHPKSAYYINFNGKEVLPNYDWIGSPDVNGNFVVKINGKAGLVNSQNKIIIPTKYDDVYPWSGYYKIESGYREGIIDSAGNWLFSLIYNTIEVHPYSVFIIKSTSGKYGLFDKFKNKIIDFKYDDIDNFLGEENLYGYLRFQENKKFGLVNLQGNMVVKAKYDHLNIADEKNELFLVNNNQKYGIINIKGKIIVPLIYDGYKNNYINDNLIMKLNDKEVVFSKEGKRINKNTGI